MHSFSQFTRCTLWGEFALVGVIIAGGNFMVREQLCRGQFYSGAIVWGSGWQLFRGQFSSGAIALEPAASPRWDDFIPRSYGIFYLFLIKKFVILREKIVLITQFSSILKINSDVEPWETNYNKSSVHSYRKNVLILLN